MVMSSLCQLLSKVPILAQFDLIHMPGIFTVYCPHGVCYEFEVMCRCESPKVPFDIFTPRFHTPPCVIIYDNAYKLDAYCLNCKPRLYQKTRFLSTTFTGVGMWAVVVVIALTRISPWTFVVSTCKSTNRPIQDYSE